MEATCQVGSTCALWIQATSLLRLSSWRGNPVTLSDFVTGFGRTPQNGCSSRSNNDVLRTESAFHTRYHHSIHCKFEVQKNRRITCLPSEGATSNKTQTPLAKITSIRMWQNCLNQIILHGCTKAHTRINVHACTVSLSPRSHCSRGNGNSRMVITVVAGGKNTMIHWALHHKQCEIVESL